MIFEKLDIKHRYDSRQIDVYNEFFNTILPHSKYYKRFGGTFSAKKFILMAEGLQEFIQNNSGIMELSIIPVFTKDDLDALHQGHDMDELISNNWINDLSKIEEKFLEDHKKALAWMIANDYLKIKLIIVRHEDGSYFTTDELNDQNIFRKEIGVFYNNDDDSILSFHGTIDRDNLNTGELYQLDVFRSWLEIENERIQSDYEEFSNFWDRKSFKINNINCEIKPLTKHLLDFFKNKSPKNKSDIPKLKKLPILRKYQNSAIESWLKNNGKGIFEMATGSGKTFTAIGCIKKINSKTKNVLVIIAVPYANLIDQWAKELKKWSIEPKKLIATKWESILHGEISYMNRHDDVKLSVLITTHSLFSKDDFIKQIKKSKISTFLIVDEVHHVGSKNIQHGLDEHYTYRLGLSATVERYFDHDGTEHIRKYFTGTNKISTVATYTLKQAIDDDRLCKYNYYPYFIDLDDEEYLRYSIMTRKAARLLNAKNIADREKGKDIIIQRAKIIRDAKNKIQVLIKMLKEIESIQYLLIFCSENQYEYLNNILDNPSKLDIDRTIIKTQITHDNPKTIEERVKRIRSFADGDYNVLIANKVLDEGVDIPEAKNCIVLASTGNPTQFIQRRGRVLRKYNDVYNDGSKKTHANIYDILVKPRLTSMQNERNLEISIIKNQIARIKQMSELAINKEYCGKKINEFLQNIDPKLME